MRSMSATWPATWTGITAAVRGVIAASAAAGSMQPVSGSTSTSTGTAFTDSTALAVATNVQSGTMTSSPSPTPRASRASSSVWVPLVTATAGPCRGRRPSRFELLHLRALRGPPVPAVEHLEQLAALGVVRRRPAGVGRGADGRAAPDRELGHGCSWRRGSVNDAYQTARHPSSAQGAAGGSVRGSVRGQVVGRRTPKRSSSACIPPKRTTRNSSAAPTPWRAAGALGTAPYEHPDQLVEPGVVGHCLGHRREVPSPRGGLQPQLVHEVPHRGAVAARRGDLGVERRGDVDGVGHLHDPPTEVPALEHAVRGEPGSQVLGWWRSNCDVQKDSSTAAASFTWSWLSSPYMA